MDKINVMVMSALDEENLRQIAGVSPRIEVLDGSKIVDLGDVIPEGQAADSTSKEYAELLSRAEIMYGYGFPPDVVTRAPGLKWIQSMIAGMESTITEDIVRSRVMLTNMRGVNAGPVVEVALELMLMMAKQAPLCFQSKQKKEWERFMPILFRSQTVGIVGYGNIGSRIARLSKAFGARVLTADIKFKKVASTRYADTTYPVEQLSTLIHDSDFVVMAVPHTPETEKMMGEKELRRMKPTAYLINVGRGPTVDEEALICALEEGRIAGAGMDVMATEPLPSDSKLWEMNNVFFSPHIAGRMSNYFEAATNLFCENLKRYIDGKRLINLVNKKKGY
ncbi:D-2-hydroxyacid dehydrogenase [Chloroflexota bacterium]